MPFVPARPLLLGLLLPFTLSVAAVFRPALLPELLLADLALVLLAGLDLAIALRPAVSITRTAPETLSLARPVTVTLEARNLTRRRLRVSINDTLFAAGQGEGLPAELDLAPGVVRSASYRLRAMVRGRHVLGEHWVRYPSPAGLWTRQLRIRAETPIRVFPDVQAVRHYELLARQNRDHRTSRLAKLRGGDTEFERLRDFLPDDEFRRIDWRATARRRRLTVREYQLERNQNVVFMLDCGRMMTAVWDGLTALDYALNAVLMLSHVAIRRGDQVGLIAFDERVTRLVTPRAGISASNHIIQSTFDLFPRMVEPDYEGAFRALRTHVQKRTLAILISHAVDDVTGRRIQALARELLPRHLPLCVLLKDREVEAKAARLPATPEDVCIQGAAAEILLWRDRLLTEMQRAGVMVLDVLHTQLTGALVTRYLEVKARGLI